MSLLVTRASVQLRKPPSRSRYAWTRQFKNWKAPVLSDGAGGADADAEVAGYTGIEVKGLVIAVQDRVHDQGSQADMAAKHRMDQQSVVADMAKAGGRGHGFVGNREHLSRPFVHVLGKAFGRGDGGDPFSLEHLDHFPGNEQHFSIQGNKFPIGQSTVLGLDLCGIHAADKADQGLCPRKSGQNGLFLVFNLQPVDFHNTRIIGSGFTDDVFYPFPGQVFLFYFLGCLPVCDDAGVGV